MLLAVTKGKNTNVIRNAWDLGIKNFGENYIQEAIGKIELLIDLQDIDWHFIGLIQSNKIKYVAKYFSWVHSIDQLKTAKKLNDHLINIDKRINVCIQVNISQEKTKSGINLNELDNLVTEIIKLPQLKLRGLMILPKAYTEINKQRSIFKQMSDLLTQLNNSYNLSLDTLSMGMSTDFESAIHEGATIVRIGAALFGKRD
jgi:pyridoxal phosphate enzyme (YggS family)